MPGIFQSLDIARRAIWASRLGMDVTSHNIANVNTLGYSRQRVENRAATPLSLPQGMLGMGVQVGDIIRVRNGLLDSQYRQTNHMLSSATAREDIYNQIEVILQEPSETAIGSQINEFFREFSHLAADPENTAIRNTIVQKSKSLTEAFRGQSEQITKLSESIKNNAMAAVDQVNEIARQIAELNGKITGNEFNSFGANDLRDRRDMLVDRLSDYMKVSYSENSRGQITVVAEGMNLVSGVKANTLKAELSNDGGNLQLAIKGSNGNSGLIKSGKLGALLQMHNQEIPDLMEKLDTLAAGFIEEVNRIHSAGQGLATGDPPTPSTGINFFTGNSASTINISSEILNDVSKIAASNDGTPGNGDVALAISNIRNTKIFNGGTQTLDDYYTGIIKNMAIDIETAQNSRHSNQLLKEQIQNQRESESGVSLDEEMTNLIKYQRSFEAAAKVVQVVDQMMETVVNMI